MLSARNPMDLPGELPVFPLGGVVLMPFGHVPLNIFEPRYLNMVDDALAGARIIAMVQPREPQSDLVPDDAALFDVATAGRIISFQDSGNGSYQITLEGLTRFRIKAEKPMDPARGYRRVETDFSPYPHDLHADEQDDGPGRERILELMRDYFTGKGIDAHWESVSEAPYAALVSSLVMSCPFEIGEKQALLECDNHAARARMLISLFEMSLEGGDAPTSLRH